VYRYTSFRKSIIENKHFARSFTSRKPAPFPEANHMTNKNKAPKDLFQLFINDDILEKLASSSNQYALASLGLSPNISAQEIKVFFAILLLTGYHTTTNIRHFWSTSEDTTNILIKAAMPRDRFLLIKRSFHIGTDQDMEKDGIPDRYFFCQIFSC